MKVYTIKRYKITEELKEAIRNHNYSMRKMGRILGFELKNVYNKNISINEEHLKKLSSLLNLNLQLEEIKFDFTKNLGTGAFTKQIKSIEKCKKSAEFIGIMLGDGNLYRNRIKISLDKRNRHYINYVKNLFNDLFGIKLKESIVLGTNQIHLYCYNYLLTDELLNLGLKRGDKIENQLGIPLWIKENKEFAKRCIKGLIDTDGCIFVCKRERQKYVNFTNHNKKLFEDFKEVTKNLGYSFVKSNKTNTRLYRKAEVVKFIKDINPLKSIQGDIV